MNWLTHLLKRDLMGENPLSYQRPILVGVKRCDPIDVDYEPTNHALPMVPKPKTWEPVSLGWIMSKHYSGNYWTWSRWKLHTTRYIFRTVSTLMGYFLVLVAIHSNLETIDASYINIDGTIRTATRANNRKLSFISTADQGSYRRLTLRSLWPCYFQMTLPGWLL